MPHDGHDHDHDHTEPPSDIELRVKSLESLLVEKGLVDPATLDALVDRYEHHVGPQNGKKVVARAWTDPAYRQWLQDDASAAIGDFGFKGRQGEHMVCVENGPKVHNLVVCTLCSCYPWTVLGLPPVWYKSAPYRSRAVADPRGVLTEFGTTLAPDVDVRVWDSTSEMRYLVIPERPAGTDGWTAEQLEQLITRNSMIGVEKARTPEELKGAAERTAATISAACTASAPSTRNPKTRSPCSTPIGSARRSRSPWRRPCSAAGTSTWAAIRANANTRPVI